MRKLIVSNLVSLDGYYEGKDRSLDALFDYFHDDYSGDENFDHYNAEKCRHFTPNSPQQSAAICSTPFTL
jgi:hypothetical protein